MTLQLRVAADTHIGLVRETNQDSAYAWAMNPDGGISAAVLIVADGIGGYWAGDVASEIATITLAQKLVTFIEEEISEDPQPLIVLEARLREAMLDANLAVWKHAKAHLDGEEMGCTLTSILIQGLDVLLAHVGDSRAYFLENGTLRQISKDHTPAGELYQMGQISVQEMHYHPQRHVLTRAVGLSPMLDIDIEVIRGGIESRLMVCSDGLWGYLPEITLERLVSRRSHPKTVVRELIAAANAYGGSDNIGVAICDLWDPAIYTI